MREFEPRQAGRSVLQGGIPKRPLEYGSQRARGLQLRGVVTATYVTDDLGRPRGGDAVFYPTGVYCDVLVYSGMHNMRWSYLSHVPVRQDRGGLHGGRIWKPRAATFDITGAPMDIQKATNPANLDGDHVLISFLEDSLNQPIIMGGVPHPAVDQGNDDRLVGGRFRLRLEDGDPDFQKHHGSYYGVDTDGNFVADTRWAHDGKYKEDGKEPDPADDGKGSHYYRMPSDAQRVTELLDVVSAVDQNTAEALVQELLDKTQFSRVIKDAVTWLMDGGQLKLELDGGATLLIQGKDGAATLTVGDGAKHVAIVEALQQLYTQLQIKLTAFDAHVHPSAMGPTGPPAPLIVAPLWDNAINSTKVSIPDG